MLRSFLLAALGEKVSPPETDKDISESLTLYEDFVRLVYKTDAWCPYKETVQGHEAGLLSHLVSLCPHLSLSPTGLFAVTFRLLEANFTEALSSLPFPSSPLDKLLQGTFSSDADPAIISSYIHTVPVSVFLTTRPPPTSDHSISPQATTTMAPIDTTSSLVDFSQPSFWAAAAFIVFNPTFWNTAARSEYHNKTLTRLAGNNAYRGCYALAVTIFSLGIARDFVYERALRAQPTHPALLSPLSQGLAVGLLLSGNTLVLSSMWALGVTGTYLGDYFGILMDDIVTGFPFNVSSSPMYHGSTLSFLGTALWFGKPAGVVLTGLVWTVYSIALRYEDPFTAEIYAKRDREQKKSR
ncbi:hypothetical protein Q7P35_010378 [Cladosporium inversicolor]